MSEKKIRVREMVENLLTNLPPAQRLMVQAFYPQFQACLNSADDTLIDELIGKGKAILHYLETGEQYGESESY